MTTRTTLGRTTLSWHAVRWALLGVLAIAAAVTALLGDPTAAWATGSLAALAALGVLVPPLLDDIAQRRKAERSRAERIAELVPGWPLALADVDPYERLGVTRSAKAEEHEFHGVRAPYVDRVTEPDLATALRESTCVLLRGPSKAGKSRTAFEVARQVFPGALVIVPRRPRPTEPTLAEVLKTLGVERSADGEKVLLWLDDVQDFIAAGSVDESLWTAIESLESVISVVATIRDAPYDLLLYGTGAPGEHIDLSETARRQGRDLILRATEVALAAELGPDELEAAERYYPGEDFSVGLGAQLVDAPLLVRQFERGKSSNPAGAALVHAAIDWSRAGVPRPISRDELFALARVPAYRSDAPAVPAFTDVRLQHGLRWACEPQKSGLSLLRDADDSGETFVSFDYLEDYAEGAVEHGAGERQIPADAWNWLVDDLEGEELLVVGLVAKMRGAIAVARDAWSRAEGTLADPERRLEASIGVATTLRDLGASDEAYARLEELSRNPDVVGGPREALVLSNLGLARLSIGQAAGTRDLERSVELAESGDAELRSAVLANLATGLLAAYRPAEAVDPARRALALAEENDDEVLQLICLVLLGSALGRSGTADEALTELENASQLAEEFGNPDTYVTQILLARTIARMAKGDREGAMSDNERAYELRVRMLGERNGGLVEPLIRRADLRQEDGDHAGAIEALREALDIAGEALGEHNPDTAVLRARLARALTAQGDHEEAYQQIASARDVLIGVLGTGHPTVASVLFQLGVAEEQIGRDEDALATFVECVALEETVHGKDDVTLSYTLVRIGQLRLRTGDVPGAVDALRRALAIREGAVGRDDRALVPVLEWLVDALLKNDDPVEGEKTLDRLIRIAQAHPDDADALGTAYATRGKVRMRRDDAEGARADLERALAVLVDVHGDYHPQVGDVLRRLGVVERDLGDARAAKSRLEWALAAYSASSSDEPVAREILEELEPVLGLVDPVAPTSRSAARDYVHDLRRRALDDKDVSGEVRLWTGEEAYRQREEELGSELAHALARYVIVGLAAEGWSRVRADADDPETLARELDEHFRGPIADMFLKVEVQRVEDDAPAPPRLAWPRRSRAR